MKDYEKIIEKKYTKLLKSSVMQLTTVEKISLNLAFEIAKDVYRNNTTPDGKPIVLYNLEIATVAMKDIGLGATSGICSLLHGIPKKTDYTVDKIRSDFGDNVADIINGFDVISQLNTEGKSFKSEKFRQIFLSFVDDMRVILILMAHRVVDIRHIEILGAKTDKIINEIQYLYIPIAHRLGLYKIKAEFEEAVMKHEHPDIYNEISNKIQQTKAKRDVYIQDFIRPIEKELHRQKFDFDIKWRTKSTASIWAKMKKKNIPFEEVYDLFAIRIIINSKKNKDIQDCWKVYSQVTNIYSPNPKRLRDWITTPKSTGYESLHTTVIGPNNRWVEVQIRTTRMDIEAEKGSAAHWQYKGLMAQKNTNDLLSQVRDILENPNKEYQEKSYKTNQRKNNNVYIFTPTGDLIQLPLGATVLDFAFSIHTDIGAKCSGAKINNKVVPIRYVLKNGDRVNILTSNTQKPKLDWLSVVTTNKARTRIKRHLKEEKYKEADNGKALLFRKLRNWKIKSNDDIVNLLVKHFKLESAIDLFNLIATEKIELQSIKDVVLKHVSNSNNGHKEETEIINEDDKPINEKYKSNVSDKDVLYIGNNLKNIEYRMAKCCSPIPGDNVFGFITTHGGITIHRKNCPNAKRLTEKYSYRMLEIKWVTTGEEKFSIANLRITGKDELGMLGTISKVITDDLRVNMQSLNFQAIGKKFTGKVSVRIKNNEHLTQLIHKINKLPGVDKVVRIK